MTPSVGETARRSRTVRAEDIERFTRSPGTVTLSTTTRRPPAEAGSAGSSSRVASPRAC